MSEHTPGRVIVQPNGPAFNLARDGAPHHMILVGMQHQPPKAHEANVRRLVACWNACEGLNPEAVPGVVKAAKALLGVPESGTSYVEARLLRAAIAKVESHD